MNDIDVRQILILLATGDPAAAGKIRDLANRLYALAESLEARNENPFQTPSGMSDRVKMRVCGPDGEIKAETDTQGG